MGRIDPLTFGLGDDVVAVTVALEAGFGKGGIVIRVVIDLGGQFVAPGSYKQTGGEECENNQY
jgi:hypothetical protein